RRMPRRLRCGNFTVTGATERSDMGRVLVARRVRGREVVCTSRPRESGRSQRPVGGGGGADLLDAAFCESEDGGAPCGGGVVVGGVVCHPPPWPDAACAPDPPGPGLPPTWPLVSSDTLVGAGWTAFSRPDLTASPPGEPPVPPPCEPSLPSPPVGSVA